MVLAVLVASLGGLPGLVLGALAAPIVVTNGDDSGPGSLRQAIAEAADGDTIAFAEGVTTVTLTTAQLVISGKELAIAGGAGVTIRRSDVQGTPEFRVLYVSGGANVTLTDLTITNGQDFGFAAGGGVANEGGTLTIVRCTITGNRASWGGGIGNGLGTAPATLVLTDSVVSGNYGGEGGGVANLGRFATATATLTRTTVAGNTAGYIGGVFNRSRDANATITIVESTISGNSAGASGAASTAADGAVAEMVVTNSTISGNTVSSAGASGLSAGAGEQGQARLTLDYTTLVDNTSGDGTVGHLGVGSGTIATIGRSVFTHTGTRPSDYFVTYDSGTIVSAGYNVSRQELPAPAAGDLADTDPLLGPLADNGGPTRTHLPDGDSAAADRIPAANCGGVPTDQRGVARPQGTNCDSGAIELPSGGASALLTLVITGDGGIGRDPEGNGGGPFEYPSGTEVELTPQAGAGWTFVGWVVDGVYRGWADPLTITMDADHTVQATFAETATFGDVSGGVAFVAITELASRRTIFGYQNGNYGPGDGVQRAQMAALIARAMPAGPGTPTNGTLMPPGCLVEGSWDCEDWGNTFTDQGGIDPNLWRNAGALQHHQVAFGYTRQDCERKGRVFPCYGPTDPVSHAQTIAFITRAMIAKGYWVAQPGAPLPYQGVPGVLAMEVRTFHYYTGGVPGLPANEGWNDGADRGWFARALWAALDSYWGMDGTLPDGRAAGGRVP
jgi:hypothetical protein